MKLPFFGAKKKEDMLGAWLQGMLRHAVLLNREEAKQEPLLGTSKIGGVPHLPVGFQWPYYEGEDYAGEWARRPLSFLAQIDLEAASSFDPEGLLPKRGYLYFFYEMMTQRWGFDPKDAGCARVFYFDVPADRLMETLVPDDLPEEVRVPLSVLSFETIEELPSCEEFDELVDRKNIKETCDWETYQEKVGRIITIRDCEPDQVCKLLGYADVIQNSMLAECARTSMGLYCGDPAAYRNTSPEQKAAVEADARNWKLLAQFGTLSDEIMFGDCGCIYFYIRKEDLAARRFDRIWLILQCG